MTMDIDLKVRLDDVLDYRVDPYGLDEDDLFEIIEEVVSKYENLQEKYNDLEQQIEDNFKPIPVAEQCGISDKDFI